MSSPKILRSKHFLIIRRHCSAIVASFFLIFCSLCVNAGEFEKFVAVSAGVADVNGGRLRSLPSIGYVTFGNYFTPHIAYIGEIAVDIGDDEAYFDTSSGNYQFRSQLGSYLGVGLYGEYDIIKKYSLYSSITLGKIDMKFYDDAQANQLDPQRQPLCNYLQANCGSVNAATTGVSFSVGMQYAIKNNNFLSLEYRRHPSVKISQLDELISISSASMTYKLIF